MAPSTTHRCRWLRAVLLSGPTVALAVFGAACSSGSGSNPGEQGSAGSSGVAGSSSVADGGAGADGAGDAGGERASEEPITTTTDPNAPTTTFACPPAPEPAGVQQVLGRTDIDGNGVEEVWAVIGYGPEILDLGMYRVEGCEAVPVLVAGAPAVFGLGGAVGPTAGGVQCGPASSGSGTAIYTATATSTDAGTTFTVLTTEYAFDGTSLTAIGATPGTATFGDEAHTATSTFHCGTVTYVP